MGPQPGLQLLSSFGSFILGDDNDHVARRLVKGIIEKMRVPIASQKEQ